MILVTLGTQDKSFERLLKAIDKEIGKGTIQEKVIVQAGCTKYNSKNMELFDLIPTDDFEKLMSECDLLITHGGVGSILSGVTKGKKVIAVPRLAKYKEHTNDHQKQIVNEFSKEGYILALNDMNSLGKTIEKSKNWKPKKYKSNTDNMVKLIENYIEKEDKKSMKDQVFILWKKYKEIINYLIFGVLTTLVNLITYYLLVSTILDPTNAIQLQISNVIAWIVSVAFAYVTNRKYVFESKNMNQLKEATNFVAARLLTLFMDMLIMFVGVTVLQGSDKVIKLISQVVVIVANYIFSKIFVFKKSNE